MFRKPTPPIPATEIVQAINDNLCSRTIILNDDNGFHRVLYISKSGIVRKAQVLYTARIDAVRAADAAIGEPIPQSARPA